VKLFGGLPGEALPSMTEYRPAKHAKGDANGIKKVRPDRRVVPAAKSRPIANIAQLYTALFGVHPVDLAPKHLSKR
jgi:hypothetical protein